MNRWFFPSGQRIGENVTEYASVDSRCFNNDFAVENESGVWEIAGGKGRRMSRGCLGIGRDVISWWTRSDELRECIID